MKKDTRNLWGAVAGAMTLAFVAFFLHRRAVNPPEPPISLPITGKLHKVLAGADEMRVYPTTFRPAYNINSPLLTLQGEDARKFAQALQILEEPPQQGRFPAATSCLCDGTHEFRFYKSSKMIFSFNMKERGHLRSNDRLWEGDKAQSRQARQYVGKLLKLQLP